MNRIGELAAEIDGGSDLSEAIHWHQKNVLGAIQAESSPKSIVANLTLSNWGETKEPYHAIYGRVQASAIADLWNDNPHLAHMNIREYASQGTDVNDAIARTIWNAVTIARAVDSAVSGMGSDSQELVGVHMKLVIQHLVLNSPQLGQWENISDPANTADMAKEVAAGIFAKVCEYLAAMHANEYLASLSKNFEKCDKLVRSLSQMTSQRNLFPGYA